MEQTRPSEIAAARILCPGPRFAAGVVEVDAAGRICAVRPAPATGLPDIVLAPGFVDLQVNGIDDVNVATAADGQWDRLDGLLGDQGVTTWCPTLVTAPLEHYAGALERIAQAAARPVRGRPTIAGAHLEGPFLGGAAGAHPRHLLRPIDTGWLASLAAIVRIVTLAPELAGAADACRLLRERGVTVSLGHSTPEPADVEACVDAGATMVTHLYNAMSGLHHREPGLAALALTEERLTVGLIADGVHVDPTMIRLAFAAKPGQVALVTDAVSTLAVAVRDGAPRLADGTLAGSVLTMDAAIRTCVERAGVGLAEALVAASTTPARLIGLSDRGEIAPGQRGDLVALTPDLQVAGVWVAGDRVR